MYRAADHGARQWRRVDRCRSTSLPPVALADGSRPIIQPFLRVSPASLDSTNNSIERPDPLLAVRAAGQHRLPVLLRLLVGEHSVALSAHGGANEVRDSHPTLLCRTLDPAI